MEAGILPFLFRQLLRSEFHPLSSQDLMHGGGGDVPHRSQPSDGGASLAEPTQLVLLCICQLLGSTSLAHDTISCSMRLTVSMASARSHSNHSPVTWYCFNSRWQARSTLTTLPKSGPVTYSGCSNHGLAVLIPCQRRYTLCWVMPIFTSSRAAKTYTKP